MDKESLLHFRLGENFGRILLEIAQDHIASGHPDKAFEVYMSGIPGFTEDHVLSILKGDSVLIPDKDEETLILTDSEDEVLNNRENIRDWNILMNSKISDLREILLGINSIQDEFDKITNLDIDNYDLSIPVKEYFGIYASGVGVHNLAAKLIAGDNFADLHSNGENIWSEVEFKVQLDEAERFEEILYFTVEYVKCIRELYRSFIEISQIYYFLIDHEFIEHYPRFENIMENALKKLSKFYDVSKGYYHPMCNEKLYNYKKEIIQGLSRTKLGKEWLSNGIIVKNITDEYEAGWLSPEGKFYGLPKGSTALVHMNLAEQLYFGQYFQIMNSDGVSCIGSNSPERWLDLHGWIRVHGIDIRAFYDCKPTDSQINELVRYGKSLGSTICINGSSVKVTDFKNMEPLMRNKLFSRW